MKVLVPIPPNKTDYSEADESNRDIISLLKQYGYEVEVQVVPAGSTYIEDLDTSQYSFICIPYFMHAVWIDHSWFDVFRTVLPVLIPSVQQDTDRTTDEPLGADQVLASAYVKSTYSDGTTPDKTLYLWTDTWEVKAGYEDFVTALATDDVTGDMTIWKKIGAADYTAPVYVSASKSSTGLHLALPILMQAAINDGLIDAPPQKATSMFDIDDFPNTVNSLAEIQAVIATQNQYGIPIAWGLKTGIAGQGGTGTEHWGNISAEIKAAIAAETPDKGGLVYTMSHNHNWWWNMGHATSSVDTKAEMDTEFKADIARAQADGISMGWNADGHDMWGYCYPPNNRMSDAAMQLGSPQTDRLSSPGDDTVQAGYGWKSIRLFSDTASDGYGRSNYHNSGIHYHRGMVLLTASFQIGDSVSELTVDSADEISNFSKVFAKWFTECMGFNQVHFWHGTNFRSDGSNNAPALKILDLIGQWSVFLKDVHKFTTPADHVASKGF